jgi:type II secretion system protein L
MSTLRVLVTRALGDEGPLDWATYDAAGACTATGRDAASRLPPADRVELVLAAGLVRLASVALPPLPPLRVAGAAAYALEDRLAGSLDEQWLAVSPQRRDGRITVAIVARAIMTDLRARMAGAPWSRVARIVAEPDLATAGPGIRWCMPEDGAAGTGFVRLPDGSAFAAGPPEPAGGPPAELALMLANARRDGERLAPVQVEAAVPDDALGRWQRDTGAPFRRGAPWRWHAAPTSAFDAAIDLLQGEFALAAAPGENERGRRFVPALWLAGAALAFYVAATAGEWTWWRVEAWRTTAAWRSLAATAGIAVGDAATPPAIRAALLRRYAQERHARGLAAPDDALSLLARVAPALAALPAGSVKSATYADGHWTLDLRPVDAAALGDLDARLRRAGTAAVAATTPAGTRLRVGLPG